MNDTSMQDPVPLTFRLEPFLEEIYTTGKAYTKVENTDKEWTKATSKRIKKALEKGYVIKNHELHFFSSKLTRLHDLIGSAIHATMNATLTVIYGDREMSNKHKKSGLFSCFIIFPTPVTWSITWSMSHATSCQKPIESCEKSQALSPQKLKRKANIENEDFDVDDALFNQTTKMFNGEIDFDESELHRLLNEEPVVTPPEGEAIASTSAAAVLPQSNTRQTFPAASPQPVLPATSSTLPNMGSIDQTALEGMKSVLKLNRINLGIEQEAYTEEEIKKASKLVELMAETLIKADKRQNRYKTSAAEMIKRYKPKDHAFEVCGDYEDKVIIPEMAAFVAMTPESTSLMQSMRYNAALAIAALDDLKNWAYCLQKNVNENVVPVGDKTASLLKCNHCLLHCHKMITNEQHRRATKVLKRATEKMEAEKTRPPKAKGKKPVKKGRPHKAVLQKRASALSEPQSTLSDSDINFSDEE